MEGQQNIPRKSLCIYYVTAPLQLYKKCGFESDDVQYICRT